MKNAAAETPDDADPPARHLRSPGKFSLAGFFTTRLEISASFIWRSPYSIGLTLTGVAGLSLLDQGHELLRMLNQDRQGIVKLVPWALGLLAWSLAAWYCARINFARNFGDRSYVDGSSGRYAGFVRRWLPRFLAVLPGMAIGLTALAVGAVRVGIASIGVGGALWLFVIQRRRLMRGASSPEDRYAKLSPTSRNILLASLLLSLVLFLMICWWPILSAKIFPAATLLCLAIACWIVFGDTVLVYAFKQARLPSFALLPIVLFVVASPLNDNHALAKIDAAPPPMTRLSLEEQYAAWIKERQESGAISEGTPYPVFIVSAAGGGIRAAQWTALVLSRLQDQTNGRFGEHLFAISGVSGGSLGAAVYASLMAEDATGRLASFKCAAAPEIYQACANAILDNDFLSPMVGYMLYPDMAQRFLPWKINAFDRSRAIEQAWSAAWTQTAGNNRLGEHFYQLWSSSPHRVPSLLLNATLVDEGNRVIASNIRIDGDTFIGAYDLFSSRLDTQHTSLATAVHNSARFAYVSPAGLVNKSNGSKWGRVIDGGYFENSGVETVRDIWAKLRKDKRNPNVHFVVIEIVNDPLARNPAESMDPGRAPDSRDFLHEVTAPILGLFNTRTARASFAERGSRRDVGAPDVYRFDMSTRAGDVDPDTDIPLGWALSSRTHEKVIKRAKALEQQFRAVAMRLPPAPEQPIRHAAEGARAPKG